MLCSSLPPETSSFLLSCLTFSERSEPERRDRIVTRRTFAERARVQRHRAHLAGAERLRAPDCHTRLETPPAARPTHAPERNVRPKRALLALEAFMCERFIHAPRQLAKTTLAIA